MAGMTVGVGSVVAEKYRIAAPLGEGGMGTVYVAEHIGTGRRVALKLLLDGLAKNAEIQQRFQMEARAAATIGHPGVVDVYDCGVDAAAGPYLVMELLQGESLGDRLTHGPPLGMKEAVLIIAEVLDALGAAHEHGIVHRDLKPDNLFLLGGAERRVKVLDFGLSKFADGASPVKTASGLVMGTPLYMAPEQARGSKDITPAADLYSVGAILYDALAGHPPFPGDSFGEVLAKVLTDPYRPLLEASPSVPPALAAVVDGLLARDPAQRPHDARAVRQALLGSMAGSSQLKVPADAATEQVAPYQESLPPPTPAPVNEAAGSARTFISSAPPLAASARAPAPAASAKAPTSPVTPPKRRRGATIALVGGVLAVLVGVGVVRRAARSARALGHMREALSALDFVRLPGGRFSMGCINDDRRCLAIERPPHPVEVEPFWIGKTLVTVAAYQRCTDAKTCADIPLSFEPKRDSLHLCNGAQHRLDHPLNCVTWSEAQAFCAWLGGDLPTSEQYEYAARSGRSSIFPWGDAPPDGTRANYCDVRCPQALTGEQLEHYQERGWVDGASDDGFAGTSPVGHYPAGATPWGLLDMAGDVSEWSRDDYTGPRDEPSAKLAKETRGGGYLGTAVMMRTTDRRHRDPDKRLEPVGFRCVLPGDRQP